MIKCLVKPIFKTMLDINFLIILVAGDILLTLIFRFIDLDKPQPLSSHEFHFFRYDLEELIEKLINEDSKEARRQLFETKLDILKAVKDKENGSKK